MRILSTVTAIFVVAGGCLAVAQTIVIQPEQETVIREYVRKKPVASITLPGVELNIGSTLQNDVELYEMDVPDVKYRYVVIDDRTYLVEPDIIRIVQVIIVDYYQRLGPLINDPSQWSLFVRLRNNRFVTMSTKRGTFSMNALIYMLELFLTSVEIVSIISFY